MKRSIAIAMTLLIALAGCVPETGDATAIGIMDEAPEQHVLLRAAEIEWEDGPDSFEPGAQVTLLEGHPGAPEMFTLRIRMPDGFQIAPHWHPNVERVTVISGLLHLGTGKVIRGGAMERLEPGSYTVMRPGLRHYATAEGETVIQVTSVGPWQVTYVNPDDDPRSWGSEP